MAETFDAIVIGGGVIGASALFQLASLGCGKALLLERGEIAGGMTAHSSGIVRTHYSVPANVASRAPALPCSSAFAISATATGRRRGPRLSGYLIVAPPGPASDAVRASIAMQRGLGVEAQLLDRKAALGATVAGAGRHRGDRFRGRGGRCRPLSRDHGFPARRPPARRHRADPNGGHRPAAPGRSHQWRDDRQGADRGGSGAVGGERVEQHDCGWAGIDIPLTITAHHVFTLAADKPYSQDLPVMKDLAAPARLYTRPMGGHLLVGGGHEGTPTDDPEMADLAPDHDAMLDEAAQAAARMPAFAEGRLVRSWSGLYDTTPDWNPVLGPVAGLDGLQLAFGFSGHGFKMSPMIGRMLAQSMLGLAPDLPLHPYRITRYAEGEPLTGAYGTGAVS